MRAIASASRAVDLAERVIRLHLVPAPARELDGFVHLPAEREHPRELRDHPGEIADVTDLSEPLVGDAKLVLRHVEAARPSLHQLALADDPEGGDAIAELLVDLHRARCTPRARVELPRHGEEEAAHAGGERLDEARAAARSTSSSQRRSPSATGVGP